MVERTDKRIRVFVPQQIRRFIQFERRLQQIMLCHFPPGFFNQVLKRKPIRQQAPLQRPRANAQFARDLL